MTDTRAVAYGKRLAGLFALSAATVTFSRAGTDTSALGFYLPMDNNTVNLYFDGNEAVGLVRPALSIWLEGAAEVLIGDVLTYDGRIYTVRKLFGFRQGNTLLLALALCD